MTQQYFGYHISSGEFTGPNAERLAWDDWLSNLTNLIRRYPEMRFVWRVQPHLEIDRDFASNTEPHKVYSRVIAVTGDGDLPYLGQSNQQESILACTK